MESCPNRANHFQSVPIVQPGAFAVGTLQDIEDRQSQCVLLDAVAGLEDVLLDARSETDFESL
jgi:hypothetical protein